MVNNNIYGFSFLDEIDLKWINDVYTLIDKHNSILIDKEMLLVNKNVEENESDENQSCMLKFISLNWILFIYFY